MTATPAPFPLEPLGVGESLDAGFRLWRRQFVTFFLLSLVAVAPAQVLSAWYFIANVVTVNEIGEMLVMDPDAFRRGSIAIALVGLLLQAIAWGALMNYGVKVYIGQQISVGDAARGALQRLLPFIGLSVVYFVMVGFGAILLFIPGLFLGIRYILSFPAFYGEELGPGRSLRKSSNLTAGRWWRTFALFLVAYLFTAIVTGLAGALMFFVQLTADNMVVYFLIAAALDTVLGALFAPLIPCMMIVAYYDGRVRKEGFDIEYMSRQLGPIDSWDPPAWDSDDEAGGLIR